MDKNIIQEVVNQYTLEAKRQFGPLLKAIILFGSCAREDYDNESDIDILVLLDIAPEELPKARSLMRKKANKLDLQYDVIISAVFQTYDIFNEYKEASGFYKEIEREGLYVG